MTDTRFVHWMQLRCGKESMSESKTSLPWSRELFVILGVLIGGPLKWQGDRFVVPKYRFPVFISFVGILWSLATITRFVEGRSRFSKSTSSGVQSFIGAELQIFVTFVSAVSRLIFPFYLILLVIRRNKFASIFNLLNELWIR